MKTKPDPKIDVALRMRRRAHEVAPAVRVQVLHRVPVEDPRRDIQDLTRDMGTHNSRKTTLCRTPP